RTETVRSITAVHPNSVAPVARLRSAFAFLDQFQSSDYLAHVAAGTPKAFAIVSPMVAGLSATWIPADFMAAIFDSAVPSPPEMMAPACPILLPGGAVRPAMN